MILATMPPNGVLLNRPVSIVNYDSQVNLPFRQSMFQIIPLESYHRMDLASKRAGILDQSTSDEVFSC
jgi:hypothetical protein